VIHFAALSPAELLELARLRKVMRFRGSEPICMRCDAPVAWIDADPLTLELLYVDANAPGARPLNLCQRCRG
jgi:hypothetical protein